jgi:ribosomal protein S21
MSINAEVQKSGSESTISTIRKFSRRVQGTGLVRTVRGNRYFARAGSKTVKKKRALKLIKRRAEFKKLIKEGRMAEPQPRGHGTRGPRLQEGSSQSRLGEATPIAR